MASTSVQPSITVSSSIKASGVTAVGPLITPFTPAPECLSDLFVAGTFLDPNDIATFYLTLGVDVLTSGTVATQCLPSQYLSALQPQLTYNPVMSPGSMCPSGYGPSCTMVGKGASIVAAADVMIWEALESSQTAVGCCPSRYTCVPDAPYKCLSTPPVKEMQTLVVRSRNTTFTDMTISKTVNGKVELITTFTKSITAPVVGAIHATNTNNVILASAVRVIYIKDGIVSTAKNPDTGNHTNSNDPAVTTSPAAFKASLPTTTIIAIAVPIVVLLLIGVGIFVYYRRRKHTKQDDVPDNFDKPELDASATWVKPDGVGFKELHGEDMYSSAHGIRELEGHDKLAEVCYLNAKELAADQRHELYSEREFIAELDATEYLPNKGRISRKEDEGGWI